MEMQFYIIKVPSEKKWYWKNETAVLFQHLQGLEEPGPCLLAAEPWGPDCANAPGAPAPDHRPALRPRAGAFSAVSRWRSFRRRNAVEARSLERVRSVEHLRLSSKKNVISPSPRGRLLGSGRTLSSGVPRLSHGFPTLLSRADDGCAPSEKVVLFSLLIL